MLSTSSKYKNGYWALIDCNNFFASCERVFRPDLIDKAIVVLSNNDGCVIARSNEAKKLGIKMGEPEFKVHDLLVRNKVHVFSTNFKLYGDISARVMATLEYFNPNVVRYSIDEAFLYIDKTIATQTFDHIQTIRNTIYKWTGIWVSIGVAKTKTLAKVACKIAKENQGLFIFPESKIEADTILEKFPIEDIWGIGRRTAPNLKKIGINYAKQLTNMSDEWIQEKLSILGVRTCKELRGINALEEDDIGSSRKSIIYSRSFGKKVTELTELKEAVSSFISRASEKLRKEKLVTSALSVNARTSYFGKDEFKSLSKQYILPYPTDDTLILIKYALQMINDIYIEGYNYAKAGIMFYDLGLKSKTQNSLLMPVENTKQNEKLMQSIDKINKKFGRNTLKIAVTGDNMPAWQSSCSKMSPNYTSDWNELLKVK